MDRLRENSVLYYNGGTEPTSFISVTDLGKGITFESSLSLQYEKDYYIRSFVVTGGFKNGAVYYSDIAYNQYELFITTKEPADLWVGGGMVNSPENFASDEYRGATSFTYNGYLFVAQGHDEGSPGSSIILHRYDPINNVWDNPYPSFPISGGVSAYFSDAVSFVIEKAHLSSGIDRDCAYIGTGLRYDGATSKDFYRLDLETGAWKKLIFAEGQFGTERYDAVGFSIDGIGYVGLGTTFNGSVLSDFWKYDPTGSSEYPDGRWTQIDDYEGGTRTQAAVFQINDFVYICGGKSSSGAYTNDFREGRQISEDKLDWNTRTSFIGTARIDAVGFNIGENGYVGTGEDVDTVKTDFYRYDPRLNLWERRADFGGSARSQAFGGGIKINDNDYRGYLGTGWDGTIPKYYKDFWHYRP